jgi:4-amino-4-deoxy-L-arabinose transferase-like glycosyltransferase
MTELQAPRALAATPPANRTGTVVAGVLLLVAARLVTAAFLDLGPDETYYLLWSHNLSAGYYDHPPMVAWWIAASTAIFGETPFGIRALFALSAIPVSLAVYAAGRTLFDRDIAARAVLWVNAAFLIAAGGLLATPDAPAVLFWALATWAFAEVVRSGRGEWWLVVGLFAGLGIIPKLTDLFLGPGILLCLAVNRDLRRWLASPWFWAGGAVAALICVPMLLWNAGHDWVTLTKQFGRINTGAFQPEKFPEFIVTQFAVLNPLVAIFAGLAVVVWVRRRSPPTSARIGLLMWTVAPIVLYMAVHAFHEQIQGHWLAPIFPTLALAASAAAGVGGERWAPLARLVFPVGFGFALVAFVAAVNPGGAIPYTLDVAQVNRGWDRMATDAEALRRKFDARWIATTHYAVDAELAYHLHASATPVVTIVERARYAFAPPPDATLLATPALIVTDMRTADSFSRCFAEIRPVGALLRQSGGDTIETYYAYLATGAVPGIFAPGCDRLSGAPR